MREFRAEEERKMACLRRGGRPICGPYYRLLLCFPSPMSEAESGRGKLVVVHWAQAVEAAAAAALWPPAHAIGSSAD